LAQQTYSLKNDKGVVKAGRQHGKDFADYIWNRAKREGLSASAVRLLFAEDITTHTRDMEAEGVGEAEILTWVEAVAAGYGLRSDEHRKEAL
jgi:hypothetical protein